MPGSTKPKLPIVWRIGLVRGRLLYGTHRNQEAAIECYLQVRGYMPIEIDDNADRSIREIRYQHPATGGIVIVPRWGGYISTTRAARHVFDDAIEHQSWE
jgi:hypothetical protein